MKKIITVIITVIILLGLAGAVVWLFMSGKLAWVENNKQVVGSTSTIICNDEIVTRYNTAMTMMVRGDDSAVYTVDQKGVDALATEIRAKDGYENDPTCQTILFWTAIHNLQYDVAKVANEKVQELHGKHIYADSNIQGNGPVSTYDDVLYSISPEASEKPAIPLGG